MSLWIFKLFSLFIIICNSNPGDRVITTTHLWVDQAYTGGRIKHRPPYKPDPHIDLWFPNDLILWAIAIATHNYSCSQWSGYIVYSIYYILIVYIFNKLLSIYLYKYYHVHLYVQICLCGNIT